MSRPAKKRGDIARALGINEQQVRFQLIRLYAVTKSLRDLADYLAFKGVPVSKSWLHRTLTSEEDPS